MRSISMRDQYSGQAKRDMGFHADAVEFVRAGEYAEPVKGVVNTGSEQEERGAGT